MKSTFLICRTTTILFPSLVKTMYKEKNKKMNAPLSLWSGYYNTVEPEDAIKEFLKDGLHTAELSAEHANALLARSENHIETGKTLCRIS